MIKHKRIDIICIVITASMILLTFLFLNGDNFGIKSNSMNPPYMSRLFDDSKVHTIDISVSETEWNEMIENAKDEEYIQCNLLINGELFKNVGIRPKGNNSLSLINRYNSDRYSLRIKFDKYNKELNYYGLDSFSLNTSFQDNSYMKDYITYDMMRNMGVPSPLCSYVFVTLNGQPWGLFVAVEEIGNDFARRNFGTNHGNLYKPDYKNINDENNDVALIYTDDNFESYENIWDEAKQKINDADKIRLIESLRMLSEKENLDTVVDIDKVLRYFTVQTFTVNFDGYLGTTAHNYYLYEHDGKIMMLPWDYNLAYGTYALGTNIPIKDAQSLVNFPVHTPYYGDVMRRRPLFYNLMSDSNYFEKYNNHFSDFIASYFESGYFSDKIENTVNMISPYVEKDPTKFCSYDEFILGAYTFEQFCSLRAKSVRLQLDGVIPPTIKGQEQDKSNFVDASFISIADLGNLKQMERFVSE